MFPRPTPLETGAGMLLGDDADAPPWPRAFAGVRAEMEAAVLPMLERPPCVVSFSGGRDSSAVLALATAVARREGLEDPVPVTMRFPSAPDADEDDWQSLVLSHLRLRRREVLDLDDELDALGAHARHFIETFGVRAPANTYMHAPVLDVAAGGSLLTGVGGDELLASRAARHVLLLHAADRPRRGDGRALLRAAAPAGALAWRRLRRGDGVPWLTPEGQAALQRAAAVEELRWPGRWDRSVRFWYGTRSFASMSSGISSTGRSRDVAVAHPFARPEVIAAFARDGGPTGFTSRTMAMRRYFGDLLPAALLERRTKAVFSVPFWGPCFRDFVAEWDGTGLDASLVDPEALKRAWSDDDPDFRSAMLLHAAWLSRHETASRPNLSPPGPDVDADPL